MKFNQLIIILLLSALITSCITTRELTYLQHEGVISDTIQVIPPEDYRIQSFDNLFIRVVTPDPKLSEMFNTLQTTTSGINVTEQSADLISYSVDKEGYIELPYAGRFRVSDKSLYEVKTELEVALKAYVTDPAVTVKMINNYISIIGEVHQPGRYAIYKDRMNVFQALALAGDLGDFSNRQKVQIIRQTSSGIVVKEFSLIDRSILTSEFFYVKPNDVVYAEPIKGRFFLLNSFPYTVVLGSITTLILLLSFVQ